ncbi:MAG: hypothetical protein QM757_20920 [Paludibaculum sp.]
MRPIVALRSDSGSPVTEASVRTGLPMPPQATGAVFAMRQTTAVSNGRKPSPIIMDAVTATGAPPPPAPSSTAPNAKAINSSCSRRSSVSPPMEPLIVSNWPLSTMRS